MAINSKAKGNRGELIICKIFTEKFGVPFSRIPTSGAFGTTHKMSEAAQTSYSGDILCPDNFLFTLENKLGYDLDLYNLFQKENGDKKNLFKFMEQAQTDALKISWKKPLVVYTRTRKKPLVFFIKENGLENVLDQYLTIKFNNNEWIGADLMEVLNKFPKNFFFKE